MIHPPRAPKKKDTDLFFETGNEDNFTIAREFLVSSINISLDKLKSIKLEVENREVKEEEDKKYKKAIEEKISSNRTDIDAFLTVAKHGPLNVRGMMALLALITHRRVEAEMHATFFLNLTQ